MSMTLNENVRGPLLWPRH